MEAPIPGNMMLKAHIAFGIAYFQASSTKKAGKAAPCLIRLAEPPARTRGHPYMNKEMKTPLSAVLGIGRQHIWRGSASCNRREA